MRLDAEILDGPPGEGARVVALALCQGAGKAAARLGPGSDPESLHDFRVALRRLRSALRAWWPLLEGAVGARTRRRLRKLARATGATRDAEVLLEWLGTLPERLPPAYRPALEWFSSRVEAARDEGYAEVRGWVAARFARRERLLAQALAAGGEAPGATSAETFGAALAARIRAQAVSLRDALAKVSLPADLAEAHRARIEAKRLRYLLEPLRGNARADADQAVALLKRLQDVLGELNDARRAEAEIASARVVQAAERSGRRGEGDAGPDLRPGLLAVERLAAERVAGLFSRLERDWLKGGATAALDRAWEVVAALEWRDAEEAAVEGRLLLSELPAEARGEVEEMEQGWLPGGREAVGVVRSASGERFFRSTLQGKGRRVEAVEEIERADFEAYWPLTEGRRIHKRRHRPAGEPGWCFDEYLDRKLVLAVRVEGGGAVPPRWLEPVFVRDVSDERGYADEALARRGARKAGSAP